MAKKDKTAAATSTASGFPKMRFKYKLMLIILSLTMMVVLHTGFVFFVIAMLPATVAYYVDRSKHRYTFKTIFAANLSGTLPYVTKLIEQGPSSANLLEVMGNIETWGIIYGASMVGWMLVQICPMLATSMVTGMHQAQITHCETLQKKLESEWGPEVTQFSGNKEQD